MKLYQASALLAGFIVILAGASRPGWSADSKSSSWTERLRRRKVTIAERNDREYLFEGWESVPA